MVTAGKHIRIYFEGDKKLTRGFHTFLLGPGTRGAARVNLSHTDGQPIRDFRRGQKSHPGAVNLLLLDSDEMPNRRQELADCPDNVFWMTELMEAWFVADSENLRGYYGKDFNDKAMPSNPEVERIPKKDVVDGLKGATRDTQKGVYHKTRHAPDLLMNLDREKVKRAAMECERLFRRLDLLLAAE